MIDHKFNLFIYFLLQDLEEIESETNPEKKSEKLKKVIGFLRKEMEKGEKI